MTSLIKRSSDAKLAAVDETVSEHLSEVRDDSPTMVDEPLTLWRRMGLGKSTPTIRSK